MPLCNRISNLSHLHETPMKTALATILLSVLLLDIFLTREAAAAFQFQGQATAWGVISENQSSRTQLGLRYIPELSMEKPVSDRAMIDTELSINAFGFGDFVSLNESRWDGKVDPYRLWIRYATSQFEARLGLQKINFGSATHFRPLMWFDRIDPRDPLQLSDGVYGLLIRYYFLNNTNIWFWGLLANNDRKGWETLPTDEDKVEFGGRIQAPIGRGEIGLSYHHRKIDLESGLVGVHGKSASENRFGFDARWDIVVGFWVEATLIHQDIDALKQNIQRYVTVGLDYTFGVGNGLHSLYEHFWQSASESSFGAGNQQAFSALSLNYPVGLFDSANAIAYYDWDGQNWYRFVRWERTFDLWNIHVMGFWNPDAFRINQTGNEGSLFSGKGIQIMVVMNH